MKKIISKILIIFIIMVILFEFTVSSNVSYAFDSEDINAITNLIGGLVSFLLWIPRILTTGMAWLAGLLMTNSVAESCGISDAAVFAGTEGNCATPFDIFFNKYIFFDVNFFDITSGDDIINTVRTQVAQWFYILRTISAAVLLAILIYVGIRMAISTIAEDKAKYKKMLWDWCASLALIFVLQYIAIFTIEANNAIVSFLRDYGYNDIDQAISDIMLEAMGPMGIGALVSTFVYCMIIFQTISFMIVYIQRMLKVGFLILISPLISITYSIDKMGDGKAQALNKWLKEFVYTILIQPFHCIMYLAFVNTAMKLLGGDPGLSTTKTVAENWEALGNMNQLANGFLAILCLKFINDGEKAIRKIFNFQDDGNMTSLAAGAAIGMAAIANAKKIGASTAKGINMAKNIPTKFKNAAIADKASGALGKAKGLANQALDPLKNSKVGQMASAFGKKAGNIANSVGQKAGNIANAIGSKASKLGDAIVKSPAGKIGKGAIEKGRFIGRKVNGYRAKAKEFTNNHPKLMKNLKGAKTLGVNAVKRSMPLALGMMGAAMSYATGSSGVMEAVGVGSALNKGSEEFFESSQGTLEKEGNESLTEDLSNDKTLQEKEKEVDENRAAMAETSERIDSANANIENLSETQQQMGEGYMDLLRREDELAARRDALNAQKDSFENPEEYKSELDKLKAEEERIKKDKESYVNDSNFGGGAAKAFERKYELEKTYSLQAETQRELESELREAKAKAAKDMINQYSQNGTAGDIAKAKMDINKAVQKYLMEQKVKDTGGDFSGNFTLSDKETRSAERMQESICALIDRAIVGGGGSLDSGEVFRKYFGDSSDSLMSEHLRGAIDAYQFQKRAEKYNASESKYTSLGGEKDKFREDLIKKSASHG